MRVVIDCSGGDRAPEAPIEGAMLAQKDFGADIIFVGNENEIRKHAGDGARIIASEDDITNEDKALDAVKRKKNSSMVLGLKMVKDGEADAFVSAGNTGALVAASTLYVGRLKGVLRPSLATLLPTKKGAMMLIDAGANLECKPEFLKQFGVMGAIYMKKVHNINLPKVGILNIGAEAEKGLDNIKEAAKLLEKGNHPVAFGTTPPMEGNFKGAGLPRRFALRNDEVGYEFAGNVEARDFADGAIDVLVSEGFSGNVMLKSVEGAASFMKDEMKAAIYSSFLSKIGGALLKKSFNSMLDKLDYTKYGGAPLIGTDGVVVKAHGSSNALAFYNAIRQAKLFWESGVNEEIAEELG